MIMDFDDAVGMVAPDGPDQVTPDLDELQQQEPTAPALDVDVIGPVQTHALPARLAVMHSIKVGADVAVQLAGRDLRRGRALLWTADGAGETVSASGQGTVDVNSTVGSALVTIPAASLPAGRYRIDAYSLLSEATTPDALNVLAVSVGGTEVAPLITYNAVQSSSAFQPKVPFTIWADLDGTEAVAITVAVAETGTNVQTFELVLTATQEAGSAFYLGTRDDEVKAGTAALVPAGRDVELKHCEPLYARAAAGTVTVSLITEQWAD